MGGLFAFEAKVGPGVGYVTRPKPRETDTVGALQPQGWHRFIPPWPRTVGERKHDSELLPMHHRAMERTNWVMV